LAMRLLDGPPCGRRFKTVFSSVRASFSQTQADRPVGKSQREPSKLGRAGFNRAAGEQWFTSLKEFRVMALVFSIQNKILKGGRESKVKTRKERVGYIYILKNKKKETTVFIIIKKK